MAYTTPRTWVAGEYPTAAQMNANVRDNVSFLANPPACRVFHSANQSIADASETVLAFNSETYDTDTMHDTVTNNSRVTFTKAGLYVINWGFNVAAGADYTGLYTYLRPDGTGVAAVGSSLGTVASAAFSPQLIGSTQLKRTAGQYVEVIAFQDNSAAAARNVLATNCHLEAVWVGLG